MSNSKFCFNWNGTDYYIISPTYNSSAANQGTYAYKDANGTSIFNSVTPSGTIGSTENEVYLDNDTTTTYFQPYTSSTRAYYCHPRFLNPSSATADAGKYFELGSSLIDYTCQNKLYGYSSTYANNAHDYGYVFRRLANANYSAGTFKLRFTGSNSSLPVAICYSHWSNQITGGLDFYDQCTVSDGYATISVPTADCHGVADILWYYPGKNWATSDSSYITNFCANSTYETEKDGFSQYAILSSSSKPANMGFYLYGSTVPVNVSLYYNTSTKIADYGTRYFKKLMRYIMYYSGNKATAVGSHTFKVWYKDTPTYATGNIRINKVTSTGGNSTYTLAISGSSYASDRYVNVSLADGDYFTIDGMNDTSLSGPTTSVSQTITVYISPTSSVGSYLATTTTPSCSISTTVTSKKHLAQACLNVRVLNTAMCSYLTVYYNGTSKQISSTGIYYFDPTVTSIATYTHSNLSISRKSYARAYIGIVGTTSSTTYGSYTYKGADSTSTWSGYLADVTATCSIGDTYGNAYMVLVDYLSYTISAPTIKTCTDAGSWKRYITVYNPNPVSLALYYSSNKTNNKAYANSSWSYYGTLAAYATSSTITISDQSGYSDEWIIAGFKIGSSYYVCNTIDEDATSGTPTCVSSDWYYSK